MQKSAKYITLISSLRQYMIVFSYSIREGNHYLNMWHWARTKKNKLTSQLQSPIYGMSNKMYTLLRNQSCYATNLLPSNLRLKYASDMEVFIQKEKISTATYNGMSISISTQLMLFLNHWLLILRYRV